MSELIVAIDPSLTATAVCVGTEHAYELSVLESSATDGTVTNRIARYMNLVDRVQDAIAAQGRASAIFIEGYSFGSKGNALVDLGEYGSLLRARMLDLCLNVYEVPPTKLKLFVTGKGTGTKERVAASIAKRYGVVFNSSDEFDAFGLHRLGLAAMGSIDPENEAQVRAVAEVMSPKRRKAKKK